MMAGNSNTVPKQLSPFVKGDPRINRKGRPKSFDAARKLAQQIAHEIAKVKDKDNPNEQIDLVIDDHYVTVTEAILRSWANSGDPKLSIAFMEWAYGKVPNVTELTGKDGSPIEIDYTMLSDEERAARIERIFDAARTRRSEQAGSDASE